ncbi:guanosine-5'-triphosphate,3'-diphosphate pyrophosphatase [Andreesenia angusta]|uniref:Guanosine-5'-triphosphate,3'-diphosphate pyrophosphatase n=1 Tax=Andreesenia angusta TaxID=39480 RepID=A0A1S1V7W5_9FIRM|nr:Ppx/GppA phosphatase family protein [Andreesenia angusta]OHW62584.1 guanosine-5'-triphosphate,3'-diphosphate pyrophosphatase [Andreesenia angusta]
MNTVGVIDIGSNSVRLVIAVLEKDRKHFKILDEVKSSIRLGRDIDSDGNLDKSRVNNLIDALKGFKSLYESIKVEKMIVVATAAIRSARNRDEVVAKIKSEVGLDVEVISGEDEAYYDYYGTINSTSITEGLFVDIGGCSTELIHVKDRLLVNSISLPIGSLNITDMFNIKDSLSPELELEIQSYLEDVYDSVPWLGDVQNIPLVGIGGTFRTIAKVERKKKNYPFDLTHNYRMDKRETLEVCEILKESSSKQRKKLKGLSKDRSDIILGATLVVDSIFKYCNLTEVYVSGSGIREGYIYEYILGDKRKLIDDVVDYEIRRIMARYDVLVSHAEHIWSLSESLFEQLKPVHKISEDVYNIFKTASLLHDIGVSIGYYNHHIHSFYIILNSNIKGLSHKEMLMAAFAASMHRSSKVRIEDSPYSSMLSLREKEIAEKLGAILKISEALDRRLDSSISGVSATIGEDHVKLSFDTDLDSLELERNNLSMIAPQFEKTFDFKLSY